MVSIRLSSCVLAVLLVAVFAAPAAAQSTPALLNGTITDPTGAVVPNAEVTITDISTNAAHKVQTGQDGLYAFPQLPPAAYELKVSAAGFREYSQKGIKLNLGDKYRLDIKLEVGAAQQVIEVTANASPLNFENAEQKGGVAPETMGELPLMVNNGVRSAAQFVTLLPGASSPTGDALGSHLNGAVRYAGEALLNGASLVNPSGGQGMYSAAMDFAQSPDMVSELKVLQANYEPQYGSTGGAVMIMETKSGSNQFHGSVFEYLRNTALNARQFGADVRPRDIENDFGGSIGGPLKLPGAWSNWNKTYFFFNWEGFRQRGAPTRDWMTIPSLQERQGDFTDWVDGSGKMIPIYDPATTTVLPDGSIQRQQFMGCDGQHPNVICPDRFQNSLALQWLNNLPQPTRPGPKFNYLPAGFGSNWNAGMNLWNVRIDEYLGSKDHITASIFHRDLPTHTESRLPDILSNDSDTYKYTWANRLNWDHIFSPTLLYHFSGGYDHDYFQQGGHSAPYADQLPQIPGAPSHKYPPHITFSDDFTDYANGQGLGPDNKWPAPAFVFNQMLTWVKNRHTLKFGFEYRNQRNSNLVHNNESGSFYFDSLSTGLLDQNSGSPIASFLLERVSSGNFDYRPYPLWSARWGAWIAHVGDTWKVTPNLSLNLGIRWEMHEPSVEQHDVMSFFDAAGANPGAGGRAGRLAFAGKRWGEYSYGKRYPEDLFRKGFSPRVGIAYTLNQKTVVRTGYGIFYDAGYYPGWTSGIGTDGFNAAGLTFSGSNGGLDPAFLLSQGLPDNWE
ncbi:MAG TPA: carboxypeptidase regulatory-like domain-containing protein, partial [Bryobacteraceae bacterium]|nr:carboxypeptidase regulatory-like domain-containing protein [Bryobacteraceae bacterium]